MERICRMVGRLLNQNQRQRQESVSFPVFSWNRRSYLVLFSIALLPAMEHRTAMIRKLLDVRRLAQFKSQPRPDPEHDHPAPAGPLRIVHAGGVVETYYMAVPAGKIMEKYPSCVLARPEVFRRPWDSVVRPDEMLTLGSKFYVVPKHTVKKLRRRIRRPAGDMSIRSCLLSESSRSRSNRNLEKKHVKFADLEMKKKKNNKAKKEGNGGQTNKKENRSLVWWQPSLTSIDEH